MDIMTEIRIISKMFFSDDAQCGLRRLQELWDRIPDPKTETTNAYLVLEYGVAFSIKCGDLDKAKWWASFATEFASKRKDLGEAEFLIGKVAFARGELDSAKEWFGIANQKSEGKIFAGEDKMYMQLLR